MYVHWSEHENGIIHSAMDSYAYEAFSTQGKTRKLRGITLPENTQFQDIKILQFSLY